MKICKNCNLNYKDDVLFCPECGSKLEIKPEEKICKKCGRHLEDFMAFCPECGKKFINDDNHPVKSVDGTIILDHPTLTDNSSNTQQNNFLSAISNSFVLTKTEVVFLFLTICFAWIGHSYEHHQYYYNIPSSNFFCAALIEGAVIFFLIIIFNNLKYVFKHRKNNNNWFILFLCFSGLGIILFIPTSIIRWHFLSSLHLVRNFTILNERIIAHMIGNALGCIFALSLEAFIIVAIGAYILKLLKTK